MAIIRLSLLFILLLLQSYVFAMPTKEASTRIFYVVNQCPYPVWFSANSSIAKNQSGGNDCNTTSDCITGAVCNLANHQCYYERPKASNGVYKLAANGGSNFVTIPIYASKENKIWGGRVAGRTNCSSGVCETGDCSSGEGPCAYGKGFKQPTTIAEFTLNKTTSDFYDVSLVNGMSIPLAVTPTSQALYSLAGDAYKCGAPGSTKPPTALGACSWNMQPPLIDLRHVLTGGIACASDADCASPAVCGTSSDSKRKPRLMKTCGKLVGYYTPDEICGQDKTYGAPFYCGQPLPAPQQSLTLYNLYKCNNIPSCYKSDAKNTCCGCVNWETVGAQVPPAPETKACVNSNPTWITKALPKLDWIKRACPTVYTYPFDDPSSTFTCLRLLNGVNIVNYTITFCPDGKTGGVMG